MPRRGDNKISEFVLLSEMMLRVSVDTGNCVGLKEFYCESFKKKNNNLFILPSQAMTIGAVKEHVVFCKGSETHYHLLNFQTFNVIWSVTSQSFSGVLW